MTDTPATVVVPVEPTEAMKNAYFDTCDKHGFHACINATAAWTAMLAARPALSAAPVGEGGAVFEALKKALREICQREARTTEIRDWLQDRIGTSWTCEHCGYDTYHANARECAHCGADFPTENMIAFKLHATITDDEEAVDQVWEARQFDQMLAALTPREEAPAGDCGDCGSPLNSDGECTRDVAEREADDQAEAAYREEAPAEAGEVVRLRAALDAAIKADDALTRAAWAEGELDRIKDWLAKKGHDIPRDQIASTCIVNLNRHLEQEAALRARSSEPVAGMTITLVETSPHLPAAGTLAIRKWDNHGLPVGTHRLYTHPAADPDKLRVAREALEATGLNWIVAKGKLSDEEPPYGCQILDGETVVAEGECSTLSGAVEAALSDLAALNAEGEQ